MAVHDQFSSYIHPPSPTTSVLPASSSHAQLIKEVDEVKADVSNNMLQMNDKLNAGLELVEKIVNSAGQDGCGVLKFSSTARL